MLAFNQLGLLPAGIHKAGLSGFQKVFGFNPKRRSMIEKGLKPFLEEMGSFDVQAIYLDGSFVTMEENPDDIDGYIPTHGESDLYRFVADNHDRWCEQYRVDFYAALAGEEGYCSESWWRSHFSEVPNHPAARKGFVVLRMPLKGR